MIILVIMIEAILGQVFGQVPDVYMLRFIIFLLLLCVFVLGIPYTPWGDKDKGNPRVAKFVAFLVAFIASIGIPDDYIVGIVTGYSWTMVAVFILLPVIGLIYLLGLKGEGPGLALVRFVSIGIILFTVSAFEDVIVRNNPGLLYLGESAGFTLGSLIVFVQFILLIAFFYFIFDFFSSLIFGKSTNPYYDRDRYRRRELRW
ncbi:MAG: hypothetical protein ACMXYL_04395 [Candidatus Woesearchaeota archaeon]